MYLTTPVRPQHRSTHCTNRYIQVNTGTVRYIQVQSGTYMYIQVQSGTYRYIQVHTYTYGKYRYIHIPMVNTCTYIYLW